VLDTFSRRVVGWSIDSTQTAAPVTNALGMAIKNREPPAGAIIHSDHGTQGQFNSWAFTQRAQESGLVASMGSIGDCYDSSAIESFWGRMQTELLPPEMEDTHRARQRDVRIPRDSPQPSTTSQQPRDAHPDRVRKTPPRQTHRRFRIKASDSTKPGTHQGFRETQADSDSRLSACAGGF